MKLNARVGSTLLAAVVGAAMIGGAPTQASPGHVDPASGARAGGPSFKNCDKHSFETPHYSKRGHGVVAKARADCPRKYRIEISLKLYKCKKEPPHRRAWIYEHCKSRLIWSNARVAKPGSKNHDKPLYVPRGGKGSGARGRRLVGELWRDRFDRQWDHGLRLRTQNQWQADRRTLGDVRTNVPEGAAYVSTSGLFGSEPTTIVMCLSLGSNELPDSTQTP